MRPTKIAMFSRADKSYWLMAKTFHSRQVHDSTQVVGQRVMTDLYSHEQHRKKNSSTHGFDDPLSSDVG